MFTIMKMQQFGWPRALGVVVVAALAQTAGAQEVPVPGSEGSLDEFGSQSAIHATRLDYSRLDLPVAATVITQDDIRRYGFLDISEIFRLVPGFRIVKIGDESRVSYHGTAQRQNRRMKVTINGKNILVGDGAYVEFDRLPITLDDIARVTITRDANGATFGDNAFLGSIDFETKRNEDVDALVFRAGAGAQDRRNYSVGADYANGPFALNFSAGYEKNGGYDFSDPFGTPRDDGKVTKRAHLDLRRSTASSNWRLEGNAFDSHNIIGSRSLGLGGIQKNNGLFLALSNQRELGNDSRLDWLISYGDQKERARSDGCYTPENIQRLRLIVTDPVLLQRVLAPALVVPRLLGVPLADTCLYFDLDVLSTRTDAELEFERRRGNFRFVTGASASYVDATSAQRFGGHRQTQQSYRAFGEGAYQVGALQASLGLMIQDSDNVSRTELATRAALNWRLTPNQTVRYSFARGFRIPSLVESETEWSPTFFFGRRGTPLSTYLLAVPLPVVRNPVRLVPETIRSHELGYFGVFGKSRIQLDLKLFHDSIDDPVEAAFFYFNAPPANKSGYTLRGAELGITARVTDKLRVSGQYSYLENDAKTPFELGMQGTNAGALTLSYQPGHGQILSASYYGNSRISGNSYDRYDLQYSFDWHVGRSVVHPQLIIQRHIGGVDGVKNPNPLLSDEGYFKHLTQVFARVEMTL